MGMKHFDKAAHVRALVVMRQVDGERNEGHGMLFLAIAVSDAHGEPQATDADAVNGHLPVVLLALGIGEVSHDKEKKIPTAG
jgi:hypothetical protein